jgi:HD superfamily phosphohydrolase
MSDAPDIDARYEIRCPVHGFIELNHWERAVIAHPAYQRLRRIRQLAWTDYVYPGAMHTRFEHSLGVMHVATLIFDAISRRSRNFLRREFGVDDHGFQQDRQLIRFAALLHDVGHSPFSHAGEEVMPLKEDGVTHFKHEAYSAAIVRGPLREVIEKHPFNDTPRLTADEIAAFIEGRPANRRAAFWRELVDSQMDADRMDYLLRDSLHAGVQYGRFDLHRIASTVTALEVQEDSVKAYRIGVSEGGWHAAESLVMARYAMFTQVYFHKTRVAYDIHLRYALADIIDGGVWPKPDAAGIMEYLSWDDWRVLGELAGGKGGDHGRRLRERDHYREIHHTSESPDLDEIKQLEELKKALGPLVVEEASAADRKWYKLGRPDIWVESDSPAGAKKPLSKHSSVISGLQQAPHRQVRLYALPERVEEARRLTTTFLGK